MAKDKVVVEIVAVDNTKKGVDKAEKSFKGLAATVTKLAAAGFGIAAVKSFGEAVLDASIQSQKLNASLIAVTGSQEAAAKSMKMLRDFAATTPFQLTQVTDAFIKMKSLGLDASAEALRSFGNTASAMGRDLNQMIEAVADASTGEFERLKEFGIKSKSEGDKVSFTFQGVTTTVKKNAEEITGFLRTIGDEKFGTAMAEQMKTVGGAISNFQDSLFNFFVAIGETGPIGVYTEGVLGLAAAFNDLTDAISPDTNTDNLQALFDELAGLQEASRKNDKILADNRADWIQDQTLIARGEGRQNQLLIERLALRNKIASLQEVIAEEAAPVVETQIEKKDTTVADAAELAAVQQKNFENTQAAQMAIDAARIRTAEETAAVLLSIEERAAADAKILVDQKAAYEQNARDTGIKALGDLASLMNSESRKAFEVGKIAAISQTTIATYTSATESYKALAGIPVVGPALGAAAAAAAVVAGLSNVQKIASTQFGGGGGAGAVPNITTGGQVIGPVIQPGVQSAPAIGQEPIRIEGNSLLAVLVEEQIIPALNEAATRGVQLVIV